MAPIPAGKWYDSGNVEEMHDDLRQDYAHTFRVIEARPGLAKHFEDCPTCQEIRLAKEGAPAPPGMPHRELIRRRMTFVLTADTLTKLLGLPQNSAVLFARVVGEQDIIEVTACSPEYPVVSYGSKPPTIRTELDVETA